MSTIKLLFALLMLTIAKAAAQQPPPVARGLENDRSPDTDAVTEYRYYDRTPGLQPGAFVYTRFATVPQTVAGVVPGFFFAQQPLPAGLHTVVATAANAAGESAYSDPVTFYVVLAPPAKPLLLRIRP